MRAWHALFFSRTHFRYLQADARLTTFTAPYNGAGAHAAPRYPIVHGHPLKTNYLRNLAASLPSRRRRNTCSDCAPTLPVQGPSSLTVLAAHGCPALARLDLAEAGGRARN